MSVYPVRSVRGVPQEPPVQVILYLTTRAPPWTLSFPFAMRTLRGAYPPIGIWLRLGDDPGDGAIILRQGVIAPRHEGQREGGGCHAPDPPESADGPPAFPASDGGRGFPKRYGIETAFLMGVTPRGSLPAMIAAISPPTLSRTSRTGRSVRSRQETVDGEADPERGDQGGQHRAVASRSERAASLCAMSARSLSHTIRIVRREADTFLDQTLIFPIFNSQECALPCQQPSTNSILPSWTICYFLPDPRFQGVSGMFGNSVI